MKQYLSGWVMENSDLDREVEFTSIMNESAVMFNVELEGHYDFSTIMSANFKPNGQKTIILWNDKEWSTLLPIISCTVSA